MSDKLAITIGRITRPEPRDYGERRVTRSMLCSVKAPKPEDPIPVEVTQEEVDEVCLILNRMKMKRTHSL